MKPNGASVFKRSLCPRFCAAHMERTFSPVTHSGCLRAHKRRKLEVHEKFGVASNCSTGGSLRLVSENTRRYVMQSKQARCLHENKEIRGRRASANTSAKRRMQLVEKSEKTKMAGNLGEKSSKSKCNFCFVAKRSLANQWRRPRYFESPLAVSAAYCWRASSPPDEAHCLRPVSY